MFFFCYLLFDFVLISFDFVWFVQVHWIHLRPVHVLTFVRWGAWPLKWRPCPSTPSPGMKYRFQHLTTSRLLVYTYASYAFICYIVFQGGKTRDRLWITGSIFLGFEYFPRCLGTSAAMPALGHGMDGPMQWGRQAAKRFLSCVCRVYIVYVQ